MKLKLVFIIGAFAAVVIAFASGNSPQKSSTINSKSFEGRWVKADSLKKAGMPQAALPVVEAIIADARKAKAQPTMIKAIIYKMALWSEYEQDYPEKSISLLDAEIQQADMPSYSILHSLQGEMYWRYFEQNRYRVFDRTALVSTPGNDIKTWDARAILQKASEHFQESLKDSDELKKTDVGDLYAIIEKKEESRRYRPTLFDLLAHRTLDFYMQEEPYSMPALKSFVLDKEIYFDEANAFANLELEKPGDGIFIYHAMEVFRQITGLHLSRKEPFALVDVELKRLSYVRQKSILGDKDILYIQALERLETKYQNQPVFADIAFALASELERLGNNYDPFTKPETRLLLTKAKEKCETVLRLFPDEPATKNCRILLDRLNKPEINIETEYVNLTGQAMKASVAFKNMAVVYFRLLRMEPGQERRLRVGNQRPEDLLKTYLDLPALRKWEQYLPDDGDLQLHRTEIAISSLSAGYYVLLASQTPEFIPTNETIAWSAFWVSSIAFVNRDLGNGALEYRVMNRDSGKPMKNVTATTYIRQYEQATRTYELIQGQTYTTNCDGYFFIPPAGRQERSANFIVEFKTRNDRLVTDNYFYQYWQEPEKNPKRIQTHLFTDRALYRPGQMVYYKGIMVESDGETHLAMKNKKTSVILYNVNYEKVTEQFHTTNEFGSFNGNFALPSTGLTGYYQINSQHGSMGFTVEEYRLPRFQVVFDTLRESYKLGEMVTITGEAKAYAGNPIGGANVTYRVTRQARFPFWSYRSRPYFPASPEAEILKGAIKTSPDGKFSITFQAIADPNIPKEHQPVFTYNITADVTDIQGETQSGNTSIAAGYKALLLDVNVDKNMNRDTFKGFIIKATNLNGQLQDVTGEIIIEKLIQPHQVFRERRWAQSDRYVIEQQAHNKQFPHDMYKDEKNPESWGCEKVVLKTSFKTGNTQSQFPGDFYRWEPGAYRLVLKTKDTFGETVEHTRHFTLFNPAGKQMPAREIWWMVPITTKGQPGDKAQVMIGSSLNLIVLMEVELKGKIIETRKIRLKQNTQLIEVPVIKEHRGNFRILFTSVALNRSFTEEIIVEVPRTDRQLNIKLETMRSKLEPGSKEEWSFLITDGENKPAIAELLAGMYDASLDALIPHAWALNISERGYQRMNWTSQHAFGSRKSRYFSFRTPPALIPYFREYDQLHWFGFNQFGYYRYAMHDMKGMLHTMRPAMAPEAEGPQGQVTEAGENLDAGGQAVPSPDIPNQSSVVEMPAMMLRRDFRETAFFFPQLVTDKTGNTKLQFTLPESFTRWKMMGLGHNKDLRKGSIVQEFVSSREVMVVPNAPRFFRQGDQTMFQAKVVNTTAEPISAMALLELFDAVTMHSVDELYGLQSKPIEITIPANSARDVSWNLIVPVDGPYALVYKVKAATNTHSDGEEKMIPVLTNRQLVTESMPLFVNSQETRLFTMTKLLESSEPSSTLRHHRVTLEFTTNPVWYAVQALPYLAEPHYRSADALFHRFYANRLASYILNSNREIERIFEVWRKTQPDALLANLEKNQELKNIVVEETPWLRDARLESENKRKIALMFDRNQIDQELLQTIKDLLQMQLDNGGWPWMPGMPDNQYITRQIVAGLGRLRTLGALNLSDYPDLSVRLKKAVYYLDERMLEEKDRLSIKAGEKHLCHGAIQYLWARSYFSGDYPFGDKHAQMFEFWTDQASKYWLEQPIYMQGMIALALQRTGNANKAQQILRSLKNKALYNTEMGMYWRDLQPGYYWYQAPIEAQALLIEAFAIVAKDFDSVQKMQQWLVKQKQTQAWKTNRATAEAIYAILMHGKPLLAPNKDITVTIGGITIDPAKDPAISEEAGTGYFRISWNRSEITSDMAMITVNNKGKSIGWGGLYWQYFEQLDRITPHETPLKLSRSIMREKLTRSGTVLEKVNDTTPLKVGDKMVLRIELRVDRDMEYIHMKDLRAPAFEPINQISQYHYQGGLSYYENPRDVAAHYFFQYLPKGTWVFEYPVFVTQSGNFSSGITTIECLYAPEFKAHSEGIRINIQKQ
ncbi:MAG: alpha-2-macroglobulin family protein [Bacteroidales bacterium]|nr:alpha-2-macroglobulin family protein [Bacteroidales bacterium]